MTNKEIGELRRRMKPDRTNLTGPSMAAMSHPAAKFCPHSASRLA